MMPAYVKFSAGASGDRLIFNRKAIELLVTNIHKPIKRGDSVKIPCRLRFHRSTIYITEGGSSKITVKSSGTGVLYCKDMLISKRINPGTKLYGELSNIKGKVAIKFSKETLSDSLGVTAAGWSILKPDIRRSSDPYAKVKVPKSGSTVPYLYFNAAGADILKTIIKTRFIKIALRGNDIGIIPDVTGGSNIGLEVKHYTSYATIRNKDVSEQIGLVEGAFYLLHVEKIESDSIIVLKRQASND